MPLPSFLCFYPRFLLQQQKQPGNHIIYAMEELSQQEISQRIASINSHYQNFGILGLSQAYEDFKKEVERAEAAAYKGEAGKVVLQRIKDLENLFSTVTGNDVKDLSMFMKDSEALRSTSHFASVNAEHIKFGDLSDALTVLDFVKFARQYMNPDLEMVETQPKVPETQDEVNETFAAHDWRKLGDVFWLLGAAPVPLTFLNGPLATQRRRVAPRTRTVDDTLSRDKTTARNVSAAELQDNPENSTANMVKLVYAVLSQTSPEEPVNLYRFFINPQLFSQSVENLFYTSFLVRDAKLQLSLGADGVPYIQIASSDEIDENAHIVHQVATFTYLAWQNLIQQYEIEESYIPHRTTAEDNAVDSSEES